MNRFVLILAALVCPACFAPTEAEAPLPGPRAEGAVVALDSTERVVIVTRLIEADALGCAPWLSEPARLEKWLAETVVLGEVGGALEVAWPSVNKRWAGRLLAIDPNGGFSAEIDGIYPEHSVRFDLSQTTVPGGQRVEIRMSPFGTEMADEAFAIGFRIGLGEALATLDLAIHGEPTKPACPVAIERKFHALETPREALEAEMKMKNQPAKKP